VGTQYRLDRPLRLAAIPVPVNLVGQQAVLRRYVQNLSPLNVLSAQTVVESPDSWGHPGTPGLTATPASALLKGECLALESHVQMNLKKSVQHSDFYSFKNDMCDVISS